MAGGFSRMKQSVGYVGAASPHTQTSQDTDTSPGAFSRMKEKVNTPRRSSSSKGSESRDWSFFEQGRGSSPARSETGTSSPKLGSIRFPSINKTSSGQLDVDTLNQYAAQWEANHTTNGERFKKTVSGMGKTYLGSVVNAGGVAARVQQGIYSDMTDESIRGWESEIKNWTDSLNAWRADGSLTKEEEDYLTGLIQENQKKIDIYQKAQEARSGASKSTYALADKISASGTQDIEAAKNGLGTIGRFVVDTGVAMGQLGIDIGAAAATGGSAMLPMAVRSFGGGTQQARQEGADEGQAFLYGAASAVLEAATEQIGNIGVNAKFFGKGALDDVMAGMVTALENRARTTTGKAAMKLLGTSGMAFLSEGFEEFVSAIASPVLERVIYSDDPINVGEVLGDALYDFLVGGAVGGISGAAHTATGMAIQKMRGITNANDVVQEEPAQQIQDEEVQPEQQDQQTAREAAILRILEENGVTGTPANRQAQGVAALIDGGELSSNRADEIRKSRAAQAAYTQITGETIDTTGRPAEVRARIKQMALDKAAERNAQNVVETIPTQAAVETATQEATEAPVTPVTTMGTVDTNQAETSPVIQYTPSPASDLDTISQRVSNINLVDRMAQESQVLGEAGRAAAMTRYDGTADPSDYYAGFMQAYNDGMNGKRNRQNSVLTKEQYNQAYNAGRTDSRAGLTREGAGLVRNASAVKLRDAGTIDALAKKLGVTVVAEDTIFSPDGRKSGANGYIKGREIHIALDAEDPSMVVFKHEVTHYLQEKSAKSYQAFRDYAVQAMGEDEVRRVQDLYRRGGVELTWDGAMDEVAANYTENLLTDEEAVRRLIRDDRSLAQKILDAIRGLVQKVTSQEGAKLRQAERLWTEMFREIAGQEQADRGTMEVRYSVQNLTPDERSAILSYKSSESYKVNAKLREGIDLTDMEQAMVDELDRALEKLPKVHGTVYRTLNFDDVLSPQEEYEDFIANHQAGFLVAYKAYTSASTKTDGYPLADGTKYGVTLEITSRSARDLAGLGNNFESEALFPRRTVFDITRVTTDKSGHIRIYMEEVEIYGGNKHQGHDTQKRGMAVRDLQEAHPAHTDLRDIPRTDTRGDHVRGQNLQESGTEGTSEQEVTRFSLKQENQRLRELNQYLREEISDPSVVRTSRNGVKKLASRLVSEYDSTVDKGDISTQLLSLYDFIANGKDASGNELTWTEVSRRAKEIAQDILSGAVAQGNPLYEEYADVRSYVKQQAIVVPKDSRGDFEQFGGWGEFRKRNAGRMKLMNDGLPSDVFYQELSSQWPELFPEDISNPADQMIHTAEILQYLDAVYENPYQQEMDVYTRYLADEILESFYEVPQRTTYAQRQQLRQTKQAIRYEKRIDSLRQRQKERIADLRAQGRDRIKQAVAEQREESAKKLDALKRKYQGKEAATRDRREAAATRAKIQRHVKKLSQLLLRPSDKSHVPEALKKPVAALLESINLESQYTVDPKTGKRKKNGGGDPTKRTQAFQELRKVYAEISGKGEDMVIDPSLFGSEADGIKGAFDAVIDMRDTRLSDMTQEQLETVWKVVRAVEHSITTAGRILSKTKYAATQDWARAVEQDTASRRSKRTLTEIGALKSLENPYTFFSHYGEAGHAVYRMLRNAQDKQQLMVDRIAQEVGKITDPKSVEQLEKTVHTFTTERGDSLTLSTAQVMELYELTKRKQAHEHLLKGGIVQPEIKSSKIRRGTNAILLSEGDLANIIKVLSEEEMKLADALQGLTSGILADYGNEASMTAYGYKKFTGTDYWPIRTAKEGVHSSSENNQNNTRSIKNIGLSKPTVPHASNALDIPGIFTTFASHAGDMVDYAAWLVPMEDANRLFNYEYRDGQGNPTGRYVKGLLDRVGGASSQEYWSRLMDNIQNGISAPMDDPMTRIAVKGIGSFKGASVGGNLRVIIQQPTAFFRAVAVLSPEDLSRGLAKGVTKGDGWKKALKYSPIAMRKAAGGFDISNPRKMKEQLFDGRSRIRKLNDALSAPAGMADAVTWGRLWNACEWATARTHKELRAGSEAFYQKVNEMFTEVIDQTQVVDGVLQRSNIMRSRNAIAQQATNFMGEPIMSLNMLLRAYDQFRYEQNPEKRGMALKMLGRTATALVVTNVVNALAQSIIDGLRDDDKDKKYLERLLSAFTGLTREEESTWEKAISVVLNGNLIGNMNPIGQVPYARDILSLVQGYDVSRTDMEIFSDLVRATQTVIESADGNGKRTRAYAVKELLSSGAKVFGVPVGNLARDIWGLVRSVATETENIPLQYEMEKAIYNITNDGNRSRYVDILYRAYRSGENDTYEFIYSDLVKNGVDPAKIASGMESRMKADQGVTSVSDLEQRYLPPDKEKEYQSLLSGVSGTKIWAGATEEQRKNASDDIYQLIMGTDRSASLRDKISAGSQYGLTEEEMVLYELAKEVASQDGNDNTSQEEAAAAAAMLPGLSDTERAYLWQSTNKGWKDTNNPWK